MTSTTSLTPLCYESPTVTLEVMSRAAAVSQWSNKPVVQVLRYQVQVRSLSGEGSPIEIQGDRPTFLPLQQAVQDYVQAQLLGTAATGDRPTDAPYLEPHGLTQHTLHLGTARTLTGANSLVLGAVQLADLADVLDQLEAAVRPLPVALVPVRARRPWRQWGAAAAGIVAAVGVTTVLWPHYQSPFSVSDTAQEAPPATSDHQPEATPETAAEAEPDTAANESASSDPPPSDERPAVERNGATAENEPQNEVATAPPSAPPARRSPPPAPATQSAPSTANNAPADPAASSPTDAVPPAEAPATRPSMRTPAGAIAPAERAAPGDPAASTEVEPGPTADAIPETFATEESQGLAASPQPGSLADLVAQVRDRWAPPADLDQSLTYTLVFAADGTLVAVIPATPLAADYRDRSGIPATGTAWLTSGDPQRVRLLLKPDGSVEWQAVDAD